MSMIWSVLSAAVQLHKGNSCWNITDSPPVSPSIYHTNTVAKSARRERTQQRHLQDGLGHTTPLMRALLWCRLCCVVDEHAAVMRSSSGFLQLLLFCFLCRLTCKKEILFRGFVSNSNRFLMPHSFLDQDGPGIWWLLWFLCLSSKLQFGWLLLPLVVFFPIHSFLFTFFKSIPFSPRSYS